MKVSLVDCKDYDSEKVYKAVKKSLENINFEIPKNIKVLVKPNVLAKHPPEKCVTTHPSIVEAVVKIFKNAGCEVIIGESSGFYEDGGTNKALEISGMKGIAEKYNIELINLETKPVRKIFDEKAVIYKNLEISGIVMDVDLVINIPKLKTHTFAKYTGAVKNLYGTIPGGRKQNLHILGGIEPKFCQILVDIYQNIRPKLNIMDAVVGLEGNGPGAGGKPKETGYIIASKNAPALDIVASEIIGYQPMDIYTNKYCVERGFIKPENIEIIGQQRIVKYKKPISTSKVPKFILRLVMGSVIMRPYGIKKRCKKCGVCENICPMNAIKLQPYPKINKKKCINCYCCHENCPHDAMELRGSKLFVPYRFIKGIFSRKKE